MTAQNTLEPIIIDGLLNEPIWQTVSPISDFIQIEPKQGELASFRTTVKIAYNQRSLYIAFVCYDTVGKSKYKAVDLKRDFDFWKHDVVGVTLDGFLMTIETVLLFSPILLGLKETTSRMMIYILILTGMVYG